jgi:cytochrome c551/c552
MSEAMTGKALVQSLTCKTCHKENEKSIGPAYTAVAAKYRTRDRGYLMDKIKNGGGGVWGETVMPANPDLKESDLNALIAYIFSLKGEQKPSLPATGTLDPTMGKAPSPMGALMIDASYTDAGGTDVKPMTGSNSLYLISNSVDPGLAGDFNGYAAMAFDGRNLLTVPSESGHFALPALDMNGIGSVTFTVASPEPIKTPIDFEIRMGSPTGELIGSGTYTQGPGVKDPNMPVMFSQATIPMNKNSGAEKQPIYILSKPQNSDLGTFIIAGITFNPN